MMPERDAEIEGSALDADAIAVAAAEAGIPVAAAARLVSRYRAIVEAIEDEPDWRALSHMHGPGWSASTYAAEGCAITMTQWSNGKGKSERLYDLPHGTKPFPTFREAVAASKGRAFRAGPTTSQGASDDRA